MERTFEMFIEADVKKNNAGILNNDAPVCTTSNYATQMANLVSNVMFGFFRARFETKNTFTDVLV